MSEIKWIKIATDIFDDEKILLIESLPNADSIIVIWFKLLCLAGKQNNSGVFMMNNQIAYTDKMLAVIFRRDESIVREALDIFERYGMIEVVNDTITIPNWDKHQKLDWAEKNRDYMRDYMRDRRAGQAEIARKSNRKRECKTNVKVNSKTNVKEDVKEVLESVKGTDRDRDRERDKEGDRDININTFARSDSKIASVQEEKAAVEAIPLNDDSEWTPTMKEYEEYGRLYPGVDIADAFRRMRAWSLSNPTKRKTRNGVKRFANAWLSRAQDSTPPQRQRTGSAYMDAINNRINVVDDWMKGGGT